MKFSLEIIMDNEAFQASPGTELGRILHDLADKLEDFCSRWPLVDVNGNKVGRAKVVDD